MQPSEEIKAKLDIVDVIRDYIQLKPAGTSFRALCPFHHEKSPSFMVSPEKQIWHCFGCGKGGDIFSFVSEMESISFIEALRLLAPKAGVELKRVNPEITSKRNRVLDILEIASKYFHKNLLESEEAITVRKYLEKRGLNEKIIEEWQIGYSPNSWDDLILLLRKKNFNDNEIFASGMSIKKEGSQGFYNRFRSRIMFPIKDVNGQIVAFTARVLPENEQTEKMGKYINSPQTIVYNKSQVLFGLDKAKQEIKKLDQAILMEGQMDVITAYQYGYKNAIASSGTALTKEQVNLIKRYSNNISLAFDSDLAGEMAAERGMKIALQSEMNIKVIEVPKGKDPDGCIRASQSLWEEAATAAKPMLEYYLNKIINNLDLSKIENKRLVVKKSLPIILDIGNKIEQDFWLKKLAETVDVKESILRETVTEILSANKGYDVKKNEKEIKPENIKPSRPEMISDIFIALIIKFPELIGYTVNHLDFLELAGAENQSIYRNIIIYYNNSKNIVLDDNNDLSNFGYKNFRAWLLENSKIAPEYDQIPPIINTMDKLALQGDRDFYVFDYPQAKEELIKAIAYLRKNYLTGRMKELEKIIREAENNKKADEMDMLLKEFKLLTDELKQYNTE